MPDLTPNHPAVKAGCQAASEWVDDASADETDPTTPALHMTATCLSAALPHLESATKENLARLRGTPAGRALMAEGWDQGVADNERGWEHVYAGHDIDPDDPLAICQTCGTPNPYRDGDA